MTDNNIRAAWAEYKSPKWPQILTAMTDDFEQGYRRGYAAATHRDVVVEQLKVRAAALQIELRDALMMAYGARMNWPESAKELLEMGE